jgi:methyl-accepting chemotaxis protein
LHGSENLATRPAARPRRSQLDFPRSGDHQLCRGVRASTTIIEINHVASSIASAVEEQGAATREIARNIQQAASGTQEVSTNITGVTQAAGDTGNAAGQLLAATSELAKQSETLRKEVDSFLHDIKAS